MVKTENMENNIFDYIIENPDYKWKLEVCSGFNIMTKQAPNRFHRYMQEKVFGFKWTKVKEKNEKNT